MIINPQYVKFECPNDVIDYISRGLPPTRDNFKKVVEKVKLPDDWQTSLQNQGKQVTIPDSVFKDWSNEEIDVFYETLSRVYADRVRNTKIACGVIGAVAVATVVIAVSK